MKLLENINTVISILAGALSVIMFFLSKSQKKECSKIRNQIDKSIKVLNKKSDIKSSDNINIDQVNSFDNRKSIN